MDPKLKQEIRVNIILIGQIMDMCTTAYGLSYRGMTEANPLMAYAMRKIGFHGAMMGKLALALYIAKKGSPFVAGMTWLPVINNLLA